jgi:thiamine transport system permease protein
VDGAGDRVNRPPSRQPRWLIVSLAVVPVIGLAVFFLWPFVTLLAEAITGEAIATTLTRRATWDIVWFTLWQACASTFATIVIGLTPAYVVARYNFRGRELLIGLLTALFVLPTVVMGAAFLALLPTSLDRTVWAVIGAHVVFNLAVVIRVVGTMWEHLPTDMEAAAATLGANRWRVFTEISFPLIRPAVAAAAAIVFLFTFTSFGVIRVLGAAGTRTIEVEIWRRTTQLGEISEAAVLALLQLGILAIVIFWSTIAQRRHSHALRLEPLSRRRSPRSSGERRFVGFVVSITSIVATVPLIALAVRSFSTPTGWSTNAWTNIGQAEIRPGIRIGIDPVNALGNSLRVAFWATLIAVVVGGLATLAIAAAGRAGRFLDTGLMLPLGASAVTIGFGMLITFDAAPVDWRASWWLVPVGHALVAVPFVVRTALSPLRAVDPAMVEAAATLGGAPARAWREVVVPYLWRPLAVGAALAAAISLGEFGATSFLSRSGGETLPIAIEQLLGRTGSVLQAQGYVLATMLAVTTVALVVVVDRLRGTGESSTPSS